LDKLQDEEDKLGGFSNNQQAIMMINVDPRTNNQSRMGILSASSIPAVVSYDVSVNNSLRNMLK